MSAPRLPAAFAALEPFLDWALASERERATKRLDTPLPDIVAFHDAMLARLEEIIDYLNQFPYADMPADARRLSDMALSHVEIASLVEMYKDPALLKMLGPDRFVSYE